MLTLTNLGSSLVKDSLVAARGFFCDLIRNDLVRAQFFNYLLHSRQQWKRLDLGKQGALTVPL